ncbi:MAG: bile acid:sodium symporter family protein [Akkermansiaceae bacterium]|nr:bile acid:sodium symporter family protein [Akkermansiaceae bacterium]MDG2324512.1 bile acid:sodium symporter family protein [Akkermansiaceae bacterium]
MIVRLVNLFWLWTLLGTAWAWITPGHFTWFLGKIPGSNLSMVAAGLGIIMLGMGMTLTFADFGEVLKMPKVVGLGVLAQFLIMPLIGWGVANLFALPDQFKLGIILVSCCPGGTASNVVTYLARGNLALSVLMTMCSTLLAVGLTPLLTKTYASAILEVDAMAMVVSMVMIVLLPVIGGLLLNRYLGKQLNSVKSIAPLVSVLVIVLIVGAIVGATKDAIESHWQTLLPAVFIVHVLGFGLGYLWGKIFKLGEKEQRTFSIEVGMQNSGLGSSLAKTHFTMLAATPCAISAFFHCMIGSFLASIWSRKGSLRDQEEISKNS